MMLTDLCWFPFPSLDSLNSVLPSSFLFIFACPLLCCLIRLLLVRIQWLCQVLLALVFFARWLYKCLVRCSMFICPVWVISMCLQFIEKKHFLALCLYIAAVSLVVLAIVVPPYCLFRVVRSMCFFSIVPSLFLSLLFSFVHWCFHTCFLALICYLCLFLHPCTRLLMFFSLYCSGIVLCLFPLF